MSTNLENLIEGLWCSNVTPDSYGSREQYYEHLFEQYKMVVEMADRISSRRNLANSFFLSLHTILLTVAAFVYEKGPQTTYWWLNIFPLIVALVLCYVWARLLYSYRQLNSVKYRIIGEYEAKLPSSPYWRSEWKALGEGHDNKVYRPMTTVELYVPLSFGLTYIMTFASISFSWI